MRCRKCGSEDCLTEYHKSDMDRAGGNNYSCRHDERNFKGEHLHRTCRNCQYEWSDMCLDAVEFDPYLMIEKKLKG